MYNVQPNTKPKMYTNNDEVQIYDLYNVYTKHFRLTIFPNTTTIMR